jgi:ankyrin repeat protein
MARSRTTKRLILLLAIPVIICACLVVLTCAHVRRARLSAPLIKAVQLFDIRHANQLLADGADPNARETPEAPVGFVEILRSMFGPKKGSQLSGYPSALMLASVDGNEEIARHLVERGADVNTVGPDNMSALMEAAGTGPLDTVKMLVEHGADLKATNFKGQNAVLIAVKEGRVGTAEYLLSKGAPANAIESGANTCQTALSYAFSTHYSGLYGPLLKNGASPNSQAGNNSTLLIDQIVNGEVDDIKLLLHWGAHVNGENGTGKPLIHALQRPVDKEKDHAGHKESLKVRAEIVRLLLDAKANPNVTDDHAGRPLLKQ